MKAIYALGIATSFFCSVSAFAQVRPALRADSYTKVGDRTIIDGPCLVVGSRAVLLSTEETSGYCAAYGYGTTQSVNSTKVSDVELAKFDANGNILSINVYASGSAVTSLICGSK